MMYGCFDYNEYMVEISFNGYIHDLYLNLLPRLVTCGVINDLKDVRGLSSRLFSIAASREKILDRPKLRIEQ